MTSRNKKLVLGVIGAAAAGAALYVILSPDKATSFKKKFSDNFGDLTCKLGDYFTTTKSKLKRA